MKMTFPYHRKVLPCHPERSEGSLLHLTPVSHHENNPPSCVLFGSPIVLSGCPSPFRGRKETVFFLQSGLNPLHTPLYLTLTAIYSILVLCLDTPWKRGAPVCTLKVTYGLCELMAFACKNVKPASNALRQEAHGGT